MKLDGVDCCPVCERPKEVGTPKFYASGIAEATWRGAMLSKPT